MTVIHCVNCDRMFTDGDLYIPYHCPHCQIDDSCFEIVDSQDELRYTQENLRDLWIAFGDVPIDDNDQIEDSFLGWAVGTDRFSIWQWFDEAYTAGGVHGLIVDAEV